MWFFWMDPRFEALRSNASTRGSFIQSEVVEALEKKIDVLVLHQQPRES